MADRFEKYFEFKKVGSGYFPGLMTIIHADHALSGEKKKIKKLIFC
jgi:hypothetical protein